jgi:dipeptidyl aminopeptidase/acylaminoacyl peptidase
VAAFVCHIRPLRLFRVTFGGNYKDTLVPPSQSQELLEKLQAAGVSARLVMVANAKHMFKPTPGAQINPSNQQINKMVADFFDRHLNR